MKKLITLLSAAALICAVAVGCGADTQTPPANDPSEDVESSASEAQPIEEKGFNFSAAQFESYLEGTYATSEGTFAAPALIGTSDSEDYAGLGAHTAYTYEVGNSTMVVYEQVASGLVSGVFTTVEFDESVADPDALNDWGHLAGVVVSRLSSNPEYVVDALLDGLFSDLQCGSVEDEYSDFMMIKNDNTLIFSANVPVPNLDT